MTLDAIAHALLAVRAAADGDAPTAAAHVARAQRHARRAARRDRQVVEIVALVVAGQGARAAGLALEHAAAFPEDLDLLGRIAGATRGNPLTSTGREVVPSLQGPRAPTARAR